MQRQMAISLGIMLVATALSVVYFFDVAETVQSSPEGDEELPFEEPEAPLYEPTDPPVDARLFFPALSNDVLLRTRTATIFQSAELRNQARQIVDHLIEGAGNDALFSRLPDGTRLNEVFVSEDGVAYLDFNSTLSDNHPGGILPEQATIYSIVNSLTYNIDGIDRVKILIGGVEKETLAGHCMLLLPLEADLSITDIAYGVRATPAAGGMPR